MESRIYASIIIQLLESAEVRVMFWNLKRQNLRDLISRAGKERSVDLIILAEADEIDDAELSRSLSSLTGRLYLSHDPGPASKLRFFSVFSLSGVVKLRDAPGISTRRVTEPGCLPVTVVAVHSPSQLQWNAQGDRFDIAADIRSELVKAEQNEKHRRSVVVGDFNTDPFDESMISSRGLHAVMERRIARKKLRIVRGKKKRYLYNPMFSLLGDISRGPPGSFFYQKSTAICRFWHMFDQVLIRPGLIDAFDEAELHIIDKIDGLDLKTRTGVPSTTVASDHFPVVFHLDLIGTLANVG